MRVFSLGLLVVLTITAWSQAPQSIVKFPAGGLRDITIAEDGTVYVSTNNAICKVTAGEFQVVAGDLNGLQTIRAWKKTIFFIQSGELWQLSEGGATKKLAGKEAVEKVAGAPLQLKAISFDANGQQYLMAALDNGQAGIVRRNQQGNLAVVIAPGVIPELKNVNSMTVAGESSLLVQCEGQPQCNIVCLMRKKIIGTIPLGNVTSLTYDYFGRLYAADTKKNRVVVQAHPRAQVQPLDHEFQKLVAVAYDPVKNRLRAVDAGANHLVEFLPGDPVQRIAETPFDHLKVAPAFPNIEWANWEPVNDKGVAVPLRPLLLTHANDNSGRNFVGTEHGVVYVFPNKPDVKETKVFLDIQKQVSYKDSQNEEGFLGLAFHPKYKQNGEFFVNYTRKPGLLTVVSRFKVSKDNPNKADPSSEEVLFTLKKPMWNHSGGTICFGPDGYLYIVFGDGGGANDMFKNSRKMDTFHSKIIRIDVDSKSDGKAYGIPKDNPFVGKQGFSPEIFCYGVRNPWRMSFDRKTGQGWFADVGQNLYEEINLLQKGGDYGWNPRESFHPFGANSLPVNDKMIEPIWEYSHLVGKSITGGFVYRGKQFPELEGYYLYADYVSAKIWALEYDFDQKRVVANCEIANRGLPIMSFGEDENGELYLMTFSASGQGIDRIVRK
ncbi:MAG TPA: PQQ-dependent sugar dehydrogenase [Gemmatales bacterium]|nr:PQQ-dependent sugar dehydrogenase [Gemmatales bacterium]